MLTSLQNNKSVPSFDDYFKMASMLDMAKLEAIIRGDKSVGPRIPVLAAMAAYEAKLPQQTAMQGQQAQQQLQQAQPTVRQELIPDMGMLQQQQAGPQPPVLPEQAGVGALPAPNMQGMAMAHGGIIAFDDGGYVPGYAGRGAVKDDLTEEEKRELEERERANYESLIAPFSKAKKAVSDWWNKDYKPKTPGYKMPSIKYDYKTPGLEGARAGILDYEQAPQKLERLREEQGAAPIMPDQTAAETARLQRQAAPAAQPEYIDVPSRGAVAPAPRRERPAGIAAVAPKEATTSDMVTEALRASDRLGGGAESEYKAGLANYGAEVNRRLEELAAERERGKPEGQAYSKYEQSLLADEAAAKGKEERNLQMALVDAGLAIAGGTSRYALENIGKGALVGTKQYREGLDKLEAAAKERQKAMAMIEQERRAEARGDWKDKNEFAAKRAEFLLNAKKFGVEGLAKVYDVKTRTATDMFINMETNATRERIAREQNKTDLQKTAMLKEVYGGRDERMLMASAQGAAEKEYAQWAADGLNKAKSAAEKELEKRRIFDRVFRQFGLPSPYAAGAAPQGGQRKPLAERTDLFQ